MIPTRPLFWNIDGHGAMYVLLFIALLVFAWGAHRRLLLWRLGRPEKLDFSWQAGLKDLLVYGLLQRRVFRQLGGGLLHGFIFVGFCFLLLATATTALQADFGLPVFQGSWYLFIKWTANLFGSLAIVGLGIAAWRRYGARLGQLDRRADDGLVLMGLFVLLGTGFLLEALRMAAQPAPWDGWALTGYWLSQLFTGWPEASLAGAYRVVWWLHLVLFALLLSYIPYSKLFHILLVPLNIVLRPHEVPGVYPLIDFEDEAIESYGKGAIEEFSRKTLLDSDACVRCGRCEALCPAHRSGKLLSPKNITQKFRAQMEAAGQAVAAVAQQPEDMPELLAAKRQEALEALPALGQEVITPQELWACTTCRSCEAQCPAFVGHVDRLIELRRHAVLMEEPFPEEAKQAFRNLENNGNPWGIGSAKRMEFMRTLGVPTLEDHPQAEYVYWPGCFGAFDARSQRVTMAMVKLLQAAKVDFAVLGGEETCCGDSVRSLGNEYLYTMLASENIELLNSCGVKKIITQCPHCYHTLKYEYPQLGGSYEVLHHTELLAELLQAGRLSLQPFAGESAVYHDSCYLGRYHGIYSEPRRALAGTGLQMKECAHHHEASLCCGAGGGRMWLEEKEGEAMNKLRAAEAAAASASLVVTACPFCLTMLEDGMAALPQETKPPVLDLAEVLANRLIKE